MTVREVIQRAVTYIKYTPWLPGGGETPFVKRGIIDIIGEDPEKQDVIRHMVFHKHAQRRFLPKRRGQHSAATLAETVVREDSLTVSTDPTDYSHMDEYISAVKNAQLTYLFESVLPQLVDAGVIEVTVDGEEWVTRARDLPDVSEKMVADESVGAVRAGRRFEFAVHTVRWLDATGTYY